MKLLQLRMSGFKSFSDTVGLEFDEGVMAVVGPNGCGKSNISDAVRWVLGEQNARLLRGQKMEEVIFQGSAKRRPVNLAQVSLHFDNSNGKLPLPHQEVVITRRLSRSGQSEYLINQESVRLRDVQDLLRGTGLGGTVGAVIEARMIDRILSDRPDDRRALFEEVAGIGLYRDRKTATERRLERTLDDLQRLDDLIAEVQTQVRSLARQKGRAERHAKLLEDRFAVSLSKTRLEMAAIDDAARNFRERSAQLDQLIPAARDRLSQLEQERSQVVDSKRTLENRRGDLAQRITEQRVTIEKLEGDLNVTQEKQQNSAERRTRALEERLAAEQRAQKARAELEAAKLELESASEAQSSVQTELDLRTANEGEVRERVERQRQAVRQLESDLQRQAEEHRALKGEQAALDRDREDLERQVASLQEERLQASDERDAARDRAESSRTRMTEAQEHLKSCSEDVDRMRHEVAANRERESIAKVDLRRADEKLAQSTARRDALQELERQRVGLAPAVKQLLESDLAQSGQAVLGPLSDFIHAASDRAVTVERVLGEWAHAVLVADEGAVQAIRSWHRENHPGPLLLLPVNPGPEGDPGEPDDLPIETADPAGPWVRNLLAGHLVEGDDSPVIRRPNGAVLLADQRETTGPIARKAELEKLERALGEQREERARAESLYTSAQEDLQRAERDLTAAVEVQDRARGVAAEAQVDHDDALRKLQSCERRLSELNAAHERATGNLAERTDRRAEVARLMETFESDRGKLEARLATERTRLSELEDAQETARENRIHWQVEEAQVSARQHAALDRERRAGEALEEAQNEMRRLEEEVERIDQDVERLSAQRSEWSDGLAERRATLQELTEAVEQVEREASELGTRLEQVERSVEEERHQLEELTQEDHQIQLEESQSEGTKRAIVSRVEAEWQKPIDRLLQEAPGVEGSLEELREEETRLIEALQAIGPVNPLAMQEHQEEVKRLEFLQSQREDLVEARNSLAQALREIDQTARNLFTETFDSIRENFKTVFGTLFEGGDCDVSLADDGDPLDSDIEIRAAPRGKRTQRIHLLSSGERALVAISLLFAIYLTKPSPFCLLDEVDAPLDDSNVLRFVRLLEEFKSETQFIVITHNPRTMQVADSVYGVTMQEPGVSSIVGVRLGAATPA